MGQDTGAAATDFTAGLLSGITGGAASTNPSAAMPGTGMGYGPMAGMGMGGYGAGMGMGSPVAGSSPVGQIGQLLGGAANTLLGVGQAATSAGAQGTSPLVGILQGNAATGTPRTAQDALTGGAQTTTEDIDTKISAALDSVLGDEGDGTKTDGDAKAEVDNPADDNPADDNPADEPKDEPPSGAEKADASEADEAASNPTGAALANDPITRLQTGVNDAINGADSAAHQTVDGAADAARGAGNTSIGFMQTAPGGAVTADTIGLAGPQHIEATQTHTSAADISTRVAGAEGLASPTGNTAPAAPVAAAVAPPVAAATGPGMMSPGGAPPGGSPAGGSVGTAETYGRHVRADDDPANTVRDISPLGSRDDSSGPRAAAGSFLSLLPTSVAGTHTRLALLRAQQIASSCVMATAVGVFVHNDGRESFVVATSTGISYLPLSAAVPARTKLLIELALPPDFYARWCGYDDPASKLAAYAASGSNALGQLTFVLSSKLVGELPEAEVVVQSVDELTELVDSNGLAAIGRSRADLAGARGRDFVEEVRRAVSQVGVVREDQYLKLLSELTAALWTDEINASTSREVWKRFLFADMQRAFSNNRLDDAWFAVDELSRLTALSPIRASA
ncbi:hypothetical protein EEB14_33325 [Rhodococcus sp. WS4]|nr:hypothetical protein EEB14_33325 [Rhodococcus sp. WS4]